MVILEPGEWARKQVVGSFFHFPGCLACSESSHVKSLLSVITKRYDFISVPRDSKWLQGILKAHLFILRPTLGHSDIIAKILSEFLYLEL